MVGESACWCQLPVPAARDVRARLQELVEAGIEALPFDLTAAQARVADEILADMAAPVPMLRLLQGDVGSGKTAVAFLASLAAVGAGYQVAILVPNEVLAAQHLRLINDVAQAMPDDKRPTAELVAGKMGVRCVRPPCLRGRALCRIASVPHPLGAAWRGHTAQNVPFAWQCAAAGTMSVARRPLHGGVHDARVSRKRREVRQRLAAGDIDILVGTTALNNDDELFSRLGLVIIDEQHRFGVRQRAQLVKKDAAAPPPHVLFMTATPIPRTIAMTLMSHMTSSAIDELPPGRLPVECAALRCLCVMLPRWCCGAGRACCLQRWCTA